MFGALISMCVFLITVCGILLLKPGDRSSIQHYSETPAVEERKKVTLKMAEFLEQNPKIVQQQTLSALPLSQPPVLDSRAIITFSEPLKISFQADQLEFKSHDELNQWVFEKTREDALGFLNQLPHSMSEQTELYLETLQKISEINSNPDLHDRIKALYLEESKKLSKIKDGFHQQMNERALQLYESLEKDREEIPNSRRSW